MGNAGAPKAEKKSAGYRDFISRRTVLGAIGSAGLLSIAGCANGRGANSDGTGDATSDADDGAGDGAPPYDIEWTVQGATTEVGEDENLLDVALENELDVPYKCGLGVCGQCTSEVPGPGTEYIEHDGNQYLSEEQVQAGYILTCVAYPKRDFRVTTGKQDQADKV